MAGQRIRVRFRETAGGKVRRKTVTVHPAWDSWSVQAKDAWASTYVKTALNANYIYCGFESL